MIFSTARKAIRFSKATKGVESADPQVVTTTDKFMVRIRPLLPSKTQGEKPEKYMVLSLWKNCMSAVSALRQRRNKKAEKEQSRNFSRQQFQAELHCNMRRRAGRVGILDKRKGILNHVRIPGSDWSNLILHCDFSVFILGVPFL